MADYGIPYMGSKGSLIYKIAPLFPSADNFYDLFGGGFSVSHFMIWNHANKYKRFFYNEIKSDVVQLVRDAIAGKYNYNVFKPKWVSRADFFANKDHCAYTRLIWSFGNNQKHYLFSEDNERYKRSLHQAVVFNDFDSFARESLRINYFPEHLSIRGRRLLCRTIFIKRIGELQQLEQLEQLEFSSKSYDDVTILPNSVIYCDPPYKMTADYQNSFDHLKFWDWVMKQDSPVFVSEYQAPTEVKTIMALRRKSKLAVGVRPDTIEKIFGNTAAWEIMRTKHAS